MPRSVAYGGCMRNEPLGMPQFGRRMVMLSRLIRIRNGAQGPTRARIEGWISRIVADNRRYPDYWDNLCAFFNRKS